MQEIDIARWRMHSLRLAGPRAASAAEVVGECLGVQAENYSQATWALGTRADVGGEDAIGDLVDRGDIVRTHVLRPTWHFVRREDVVWLLDFGRPRLALQFERQLASGGTDVATATRATGLLVEALEEAHLTRAGLADRLAAAGESWTSQQLARLTGYMEALGLICSGVRRHGEQTYALIDERVPDPVRLDRETARAEIVMRYFTSHGPATERDLAYWATMTLGDVRAGLAEVGGRLGSFEFDGKTYWYGKQRPADDTIDPPAHLLQILDEYYRGYQDTRAHLDVAGFKQPRREPAIGMVLLDSQYAVEMTRGVAPSTVTFTLRPVRPLTGHEVDAIESAAQRYGTHLARRAVVRFG
ncbi:MAG: winged helix DNA-binding domain-containing protein [Nocardioides sp.]